jgi:hypothetical protein
MCQYQGSPVSVLGRAGIASLYISFYDKIRSCIFLLTKGMLINNYLSVC